MKIYTSYFYQVRFFPSNFIPISTAIWDPKWFHDNKGENHIFIDKNGVYNGIRSNDLHPGAECDNLCHGMEECADSPDFCKFLFTYRKQLSKINFDAFWINLSKLVTKIAKDWDKEPIVVFLVYEKPSQKCSERKPLQDWFNAHGIHCEELRYPIQDNY